MVSSCQQAKGKAPLVSHLSSIFLSQCYKSSKDHNPQLDVNLLGCTVIHKEKQVRKKEHKLKIIPMNADVIVLGLQSKDQAEQWLRVSDIPGVAQVFICQGRQVPEHFLQAAVPGIPAHREPCVPRGKSLTSLHACGVAQPLLPPILMGGVGAAGAPASVRQV